jgi:adenine specific DNA methylase Mod
LAELIWEGKYDKDSHKVAPLRVRLPFQTVETVNESAQERQTALDLFATNRPAEWRNRLIWGDKKYVLPALLEEFAGKVDLIYIDPPFATGQNFSFNIRIDGEEFTKEPSIIEQKAYRDTWGKGLGSFLHWFYETMHFLRDLLADDGSIYVHCDTRVNSHLRLIMDELFSSDNFINQITWRRTGAHNDPGRYGMITDTLLYYAKGDDYCWNQPKGPRSDSALQASFSNAQKPDGSYVRLKKGQELPQKWRLFQSVTLRSPHPRPNLVYDYKGYKPHRNGWSVNRERMEQYDREGRLLFPASKDGAIRLKMFLDESPEIPLQDLWTDINKIEAISSENVGYETQKPEALLERIISASCMEGDLVLDCFVGSGTTAVAAENLGRRWIACDLGRFAIHTTRKRLLSIPSVKPFIVQNLGKYERQLWQTAEFGEQAEARQSSYRRFILELYHAQPLTGYTWLHGTKAGRMVYVGAVDSPVSPTDVGQIAAEFKRAIGTGKDAPATNGVDVLGWDFAFELNEVARQQAAQANINLRFLRIPREVLEKKAVEQGDIKFFELAALSVDLSKKGRSVTIKLTDFVIPPDDVPEEVRTSITNWEQWIDYWAVDWNNRDDTFHNEWQDYRTRKKRDLQKAVSHTYEQPGTYIIMVKVIDILGNDTTKSLKVEVH